MAFFEPPRLSSDELLERERGRQDLRARFDLMLHAAWCVATAVALALIVGAAGYYVLFEGWWPVADAGLAPSAGAVALVRAAGWLWPRWR